MTNYLYNRKPVFASDVYKENVYNLSAVSAETPNAVPIIVIVEMIVQQILFILLFFICIIPPYILASNPLQTNSIMHWHPLLL